MSETMKRTIQGAERVAMPLGLILLMIGVFSRVCRYMRWSALSFGESGKAVLFDLEPAKMLWGAALILLLLSALRRPNAKAFRVDTPLKILLVFTALAVASLMWSYNYRFAMVWVFRLYVPLTIYALVSSYTRTLRDVRAWTYMFAFMGVAAFVFAGYETFIVIGRMGLFIKDGVGGDQYVGEYARWSVIGFAFGAYFALYVMYRRGGPHISVHRRHEAASVMGGAAAGGVGAGCGHGREPVLRAPPGDHSDYRRQRWHRELRRT